MPTNLPTIVSNLCCEECNIDEFPTYRKYPLNHNIFSHEFVFKSLSQSGYNKLNTLLAKTCVTFADNPVIFCCIVEIL